MANEHQGCSAADFPEGWEPVEDPGFPININIHIACDSLDQIVGHLIGTINQFNKAMRKASKNRTIGQAMRLLYNTHLGTRAVDINFNTQTLSHDTSPDHPDQGTKEGS